MKRWSKFKYLWLIAGLGLAIELLVFNQPTYALGPTNLECVETGDSIVCPDLYCATRTITCDTIGKQCYCQPYAFGKLGTPENTYCEFATGSEALFNRGSNGKVDKIYLRNGVWGAMVDLINNIYPGKSVGIDKNNRAVVFVRSQEASDDGSLAYFSSDFLRVFAEGGFAELNKYYKGVTGGDIPSNEKLENLLKNSSSIGIGFFAKIEPGASSGYIYNQMFELVPNNGAKQICGNHVIDRGTVFYHKASGVGDNKKNNTACYGAANLVLRLLMPLGEKGKNDSKALSVERGILNSFQLTRNCVGFQTEDALFNDKAAEIIDATTMVSGLIVPTNERRIVYQTYQHNHYMGIRFEKEDKASRKEKVEKIREQCNEKCKVSYLNHADSLPIFCNSCDYIANLLENSPDQSFSDIITRELGEDAANCSIIDPSFGNTLSTTGSAKYDYRPYDDNTKEIRASGKTEHRLNQLIPVTLGKLCQEYHGNNDLKRTNCKLNALNCYVEAISPNLKGKDVCDFMNRTEAFRRGRWIFCPVLKTSTNAADSIQKVIDEIFSIDTNAFSDIRIKQVWENVRNIANIILVITLIIVTISQVTGFGLTNYQIKTALPRLLVGAILINLSFFISQAGIAISNILGDGVSDVLNNVTSGIKLSETTFEAIIFKSSSSALVIAGILAIALPTLGIILFSVAGLLIILSMRQVLLILLVIISPLAFAVMAAPGGQSLSKKWFKMYLAMLSIYPVVQALYSTSRLTKALMSGVQRTGMATYLMPLVANSLPFLAILITPFAAKSLFSSSAKLAAKFTRGTDHITGGLQQRNAKRSQDSFFRRSIGSYAKQGLTNLAIGNTQRRRTKQYQKSKLASERSQFKPRFDNKLLNWMSSGAVHDLGMSATFSADRAEQVKTMDMIGNDVVLLQALIIDGGQQGSFYQALSQPQKEQYNLIVRQNHGRMYNVNTVAPILLAKNAVTDKTLYQKAFKNAEESGVNKNSYIGISYGMAKKNGDIELMGFLKAQMKSKERAIEASADIVDASNNLEHSSFALREAIIENGGDLSKITAATPGLTPSDLTILTALKASGATKRTLISAAINTESSHPGYDVTKSNNLITKGMSTLVGNSWSTNSAGKVVASTSSSYIVDSKGNVDEITEEQAENINYAARLLEVVNQNLGNNGDGHKGLGFSEVTGLRYVTKPKPPKTTMTIPETKRIIKEGSTRIRHAVKRLDNIADVVNDNSTGSLPEGWSADYSDARLPSQYELNTTLVKEFSGLTPDRWYSKLLDESRTSDKNIGVVTTHNARRLILKEINANINLSGVTTPADAKNRVMGHNIYLIGRNWHKLAPSIRAAISKDIAVSIFNSMDKHGVAGSFGVASQADAEKLGAVEMMKLVGIEPKRIER